MWEAQNKSLPGANGYKCSVLGKDLQIITVSDFFLLLSSNPEFREFFNERNLPAR
jgi:hypothetical protein